jgi:hypothetical protein
LTRESGFDNLPLILGKCETSLCKENQELMRKKFGMVFGVQRLGVGVSLLFLVAGLGFVSQANAALFTISTDQVVGHYGSIGYTGDTVTLGNTSSSIDLSPGLTTLKLNDLVFDAELSDPSATYYPVDLLQLLTMTAVPSGGTASSTLEYTGNLAISSSDTLTLLGASPVTFDFAGVGTVVVTPLGIVTAPNGGGQVHYNLDATFDYTPVPEPINYALAGFGLLFVGGTAGRFYLGRRRFATAS